jgi:hypothetical protein
MWFSAGFAGVCAALAGLTWLGLTGRQQDAPMLLLLSVGALIGFVFMRRIIRLFGGTRV